MDPVKRFCFLVSLLLAPTIISLAYANEVIVLQRKSAEQFRSANPHSGRNSSFEYLQTREIDPWRKPPVTFPSGSQGSQATLSSPDQRYELQNVDSDTEKPAHSIFLLDRKSKERTLLYHYDRWVNVLWSPASDAIVINDFSGSDESASILIRLSPHIERLNLWDLLMKSKAVTTEMRREFQGYPVFKYAVGWLGADRLAFRVTGFSKAGPTGFKNPFAYSFTYEMGASFELEETLQNACAGS